MSPIRRVQIEQTDPVGYDLDDDRLDSALAAENEDDWCDDDPTERGVDEVVEEFDARGDDASVTAYADELVQLGLSVDEALARLGYRTRELGPAIPPAPTPSRGGHARARPRIGGPRYGLGADGEAVPVADADGPDVVIHPDARGHEDASREAATLWLREHDPRLSLDGVAAEVEAALATAALSPADVAEAFAPGRPTRERAILRDRLRVALAPAWEEGRRRDLMAQALGYDRKNLGRLMRSPA